MLLKRKISLIIIPLYGHLTFMTNTIVDAHKITIGYIHTCHKFVPNIQKLPTGIMTWLNELFLHTHMYVVNGPPTPFMHFKAHQLEAMDGSWLYKWIAQYFLQRMLGDNPSISGINALGTNHWRVCHVITIKWP